MSTGKRRHFRSRLTRSSGIASLEKDLSPTFSQMFLAKTYMCLLGILTFGWRQTNLNRNIPLCRYVYNFCRYVYNFCRYVYNFCRYVYIFCRHNDNFCRHNDRNCRHDNNNGRHSNNNCRRKDRFSCEPRQPLRGFSFLGARGMAL